VILDNIKHRKASSARLQRAFKIANIQAANALPESSTTVGTWIHELFEYFEPEIIKEVRTAKSKISISFDGWGSKREKLSVIGVVIHMINQKDKNVTRLIGLPELLGHGKTGVGEYFYSLRVFLILIILLDQCAVILPLLTRFGITLSNLGYFVLDNASNNDTTLQELGKKIGFNPKARRLRCIGHILNLIAEPYLFGQDSSGFQKDYDKAGPLERRQCGDNDVKSASSIT
jgi:hypothetical protein